MKQLSYETTLSAGETYIINIIYSKCTCSFFARDINIQSEKFTSSSTNFDFLVGGQGYTLKNPKCFTHKKCRDSIVNHSGLMSTTYEAQLLQDKIARKAHDGYLCSDPINNTNTFSVEKVQCLFPCTSHLIYCTASFNFTFLASIYLSQIQAFIHKSLSDPSTDLFL